MASDRRPTDPVRTDDSSDTSMAVLARETRSASVARSWLRGFLDEAGLAEPVQADAALVISELVTNALRHGLGEIVARAKIGDDGHVDVSVTDSGCGTTRAAGGRPRARRWCRPARGRPGLRRVGSRPVPRREDRLGQDRRPRPLSSARSAEVGTRTPLGWVVAGSPRRCARPPKAMATSRNQPQPMTRPARTSVSQCTPSSARLAATATEIKAAPDANSARVRRERSRPRISATAGQAAAAAAVWPDGNEAPLQLTSHITSGRSRSTSHFMPLTMSFSPMMTTAANTNTSALRRRSQSATEAAASAATTTHVPPSWVITFNTSTAADVACSAPHAATSSSSSPSHPDSSMLSSSSPTTSDDDEDDDQADRQEQSAGGAAVQALAQEPSQPGPALERLDGRPLLGRGVDGIGQRLRADIPKATTPAPTATSRTTSVIVIRGDCDAPTSPAHGHRPGAPRPRRRSPRRRRAAHRR